MSARSNISSGFSQTLKCNVKPTAGPNSIIRNSFLSKSFMGPSDSGNKQAPSVERPAGKTSNNLGASSFWRTTQNDQKIKNIPREKPDYWAKNKSPNPNLETKGARHYRTASGFSLRTEDIPGARAKEKPMKTTPTKSLETKDIPGASPRTFRPISARKVNPVEPEYHLPTFCAPEPEKLKFLRNQIDISVKRANSLFLMKSWDFKGVQDIDGAKPSKPKKETGKTGYLKTEDIPGAQPAKPRKFIGKNSQENNNSTIRGKLKGGRNPLNPVYSLTYTTGE